jgi:hypothetical protein
MNMNRPTASGKKLVQKSLMNPQQKRVRNTTGMRVDEVVDDD